MKYFASLALWIFLISHTATAAEIFWEGAYRAEAISVQNPALQNEAVYDKSYLLHHVILQPKIVALDGLNLYGRLDILNSADYMNTQMGDFLGDSPASGGAQGAGTTATNTQTQKTDTVQVSHFYLKWSNEFGALLVGRMPLQFGLGITYNAGMGPFDHYFDTRDILGYKVIAGNLSFMPMYGKVKEGSLGAEDDINDYMFQFLYENPDTELSLGVFYDVKVATKNGNAAMDGAATGAPFGGTGATKDGSLEAKTLNLFVQRNFGNVRFGLESSFANGKFGIRDSAGREVILDAYALAAELTYTPSGRWTFDLKTGIVTGDDPSTTDKYEGYLVDRNYDLGFLLFNHKLGAYDVLGTGNFRNTSNESADTEYLTNATYVAPGAVLHLSDTWNINTRVIWAQLQRSQILANPGLEKSLGVEWDLGLGYNPNKNLTVELGSGMMFPGEAFKGSGTQKGALDFGYGLNAKAAVRF